MESVTISDTEEALPPPAPQAVSAGPHASPSPQIYNFPTNFPVPAAMVCRGDIPSNWEFFKQQWQDYEVATGLDKKNQQVRLATFRSVMGKERRQSFRNLNFGLVKLLFLQQEEGALTEEMIRDRLVIGIQDKNAKARLLRERALSLDKAVDMCKSSQVTHQQLKSI